MAEAHSVTDGAEATAAIGHNKQEQVRKYVGRIERLYDEIEVFRQDYLAQAKPLREDINDILQEADDHGIDKAVLRKVIRVRQMERKADAVRDKLEPFEQQSFDQMRLALGDYGDTPLGAAALSKHPDAKQAEA